MLRWDRFGWVVVLLLGVEVAASCDEALAAMGRLLEGMRPLGATDAVMSDAGAAGVMSRVDGGAGDSGRMVNMKDLDGE